MAIIIPALNATNTTTQNPHFQGWTSETCTSSGTASIIWQCITTIGLCTYVVVHFNVNPVEMSHAAAFIRKAIIVLIGVFFAEFWAWAAICQLLEARKLIKRVNEQISYQQGFLILSGGVVIQGLHKRVPGLVGRNSIGKEVHVTDDAIWHRDWNHVKLEKMSRQELNMFVQNVPNARDINDKSKQNNLIKIITSLQALWFIIQVGARTQQGFIVAPMQIATVAYVAMASFTYGCWWHKAYDVNTPYIVRSSRAIRGNDHPEIDTRAWFVAADPSNPGGSFHAARLKWMGPFRSLCQHAYVAFAASAYDVSYVLAISTTREWRPGNLKTIHIPLKNGRSLILGTLSALYAAVHCGAWRYPFPTAAEALIWKILTCGAILSSLWIFIEATPFSFKYWRKPGDNWGRWDRVLYEALWITALTAYLLSRLYIMIECFIAFRYAPASLYQQVEW